MNNQDGKPFLRSGAFKVVAGIVVLCAALLVVGRLRRSPAVSVTPTPETPPPAPPPAKVVRSASEIKAEQETDARIREAQRAQQRALNEQTVAVVTNILAEGVVTSVDPGTRAAYVDAARWRSLDLDAQRQLAIQLGYYCTIQRAGISMSVRGDSAVTIRDKDNDRAILETTTNGQCIVY
ncbi:MAG: hypothetical protein V1873_05945 [Verrucomicrobiota bacterium]